MGSKDPASLGLNSDVIAKTETHMNTIDSVTLCKYRRQILPCEMIGHCFISED